MAQATLSTKYQLVIPKEVRQELQLKAGQRMRVIAKNGIIHLVPVLPLAAHRGLLKGIKNDELRDEGDRP